VKFEPRPVADHVNLSLQHPLKNFMWLLAAVMILVVAVYFVLGFAADLMVTRISPATEVKIGKIIMEKLAGPQGELSVGNPVPIVAHHKEKLEFVKNLVNSLQEEIQWKGSGKEPIDFEVGVLGSPIPNAFVVPGGFVQVTDGLLINSDTGNELAFVVGHELGHFYYRDAIRGLGRTLVFLGIMTLAGFGGPGDSFGGGLTSVFDFTLDITRAQHSQYQEKRADKFGISLLEKKYGHIKDGLKFFEKMKSADKQIGRFRKYLVSHPLSEDRIAKLKRYAEKKGWSLEGATLPLPDWAKKGPQDSPMDSYGLPLSN